MAPAIISVFSIVLVLCPKASKEILPPLQVESKHDVWREGETSQRIADWAVIGHCRPSSRALEPTGIALRAAQQRETKLGLVRGASVKSSCRVGSSVFPSARSDMRAYKCKRDCQVERLDWLLHGIPAAFPQARGPRKFSLRRKTPVDSMRRIGKPDR